MRIRQKSGSLPLSRGFEVVLTADVKIGTYFNKAIERTTRCKAALHRGTKCRVALRSVAFFFNREKRAVVVRRGLLIALARICD